METRNKYSMWVEKYRPMTLDGYVAEENFKKKLSHFVENGRLDCHLMLHSLTPGTGKTTATKILTQNIDCDYKYINASDQRGIDDIRTTVAQFAQAGSFKPVKIIVMDECDQLTPAAQTSLRGIVEQYAKSTEFVFTCNYINKVIEPLRNRCVEIAIPLPDKKLIAKRFIDILDNEGVTYKKKDVAKVVQETFPSIRKGIQILQECSLGGELNLLSKGKNIVVDDYTSDVIQALKQKKGVHDIRKIVIEADVNSYERLFRRLYDEIDTWSPTSEAIPQAIIHLAEYQYKDAFVVDKEINVAALLSKLTELY